MGETGDRSGVKGGTRSKFEGRRRASPYVAPHLPREHGGAHALRKGWGVAMPLPAPPLLGHDRITGAAANGRRGETYH